MTKTASFRTENWRFWSGLRDLNPRSLGPKPSAIPNFAKPGYEVKNFSDVVKHVVKGYFRPEQGRSQEEKVLVPQRVFGLVDFTGANRAPAPKPSAIPNFAKPGYSVGDFSDVVKHVVKGYFRPEQGRSQEEKVLVPQRVFGLVDFTGANRPPAPKPGALPTGPHPDMKMRESSRRWWISTNGAVQCGIYCTPSQEELQDKNVIP